LSSVEVDTSPALPTRKPDISSWVEPDITRLSTRGKKRYNIRKTAIEDYFATDVSIEEMTLRHHLSSEILMKLVERCLMQHEDGMPWGYRALLPGAIVIDHAPSSIPKEETPEGEVLESPREAISEEVLDAVPCDSDQPSLDNDELIEDDQNTARRPAIKIPPADEPVETISPDSINGIDKHQAHIIEEMSTVVVDGEEGVIEVEQTESEGKSAELVTTAAEEEQEVVNTPGSEIEEAIAQKDASADKHNQAVPEEETGDLSSFPKLEIEEAVAGDEIAEAIDSKEERVEISRSDAAIAAPSIAPIPGRSRTQVAVRESLIPAILPLYGKGRKRIDIKKVAHTRRSIRKRWIRDVQSRRRQRRFRSVVTSTVVAALLFVVFLPLGTGLAAYSTYNSIKNVALDGVNRLLTVKNLLPISKSDPLAALDPQKLQQAQYEFGKAESDFVQLQQLVNRSDVQSAIQQFAPQYSSKLDMAQRLVQVGIDVSRMGREVVGVALLGASIIHSSPLASGATKPLITVTDISNAEGVLVHALYYINDIRTQMSQVSIKDVPISNTQKKELTSALDLIPKAQDMIVQGQGLIGIASWLLGVGQQRHFLVQTMDNAELRPGGGFTGMYGVLTIQDGRMAPFSLRDVTELDYAGNGVELGRQAPPQYSWMKFGFWGLRDANLSGDYPTSARLAMQVFQEEGGGPVDGDIALTPRVIAHILNVIGPIKVPQYNETITAQNLEGKLHYYQQDFGAIALERQKTGTYNASTRKAFTSLLGKLLLDKVRHLQVKQLVMIIQNAVKDIQSRDLEIYFANPLAESWLVQHGYSGAMDTFSRQDGFMVVQSNISISKASQYVHTTEQDNIALDAQGGAYHNLTITLDYKPTGPIYGYDTYADYIRVYAPANAQFLGGDGFDTGHCLAAAPSPTGTRSSGITCCTSNSKPTSGNGNPLSTKGPGSKPNSIPNPCAQYNTFFPSNGRYCPNGNYSLGQRGASVYWPVDSLGSPTELTTDLPGRAMWGGLTLTPKNCISTITLQWYVPHAVKNIPGQSPYSILVQKQSGYIPRVQITVDTSAIKGLKPLSFQSDLIADRLFSLPLESSS
jgi:uncharacterized protein DUF4012